MGAGISIPAGIPDGPTLAKWIASEFPLIKEPLDAEDLFGVVDLVDPAQCPEPELQRRVADHLLEAQLQPTQLHEALVRLPSNCLLTFNYDRALETAAEQTGRQAEVFFGKSLYDAVERLGGKAEQPPSQLTIVHLHGSVDDPESLVLSSEGYRRNVSSRPWLRELFQELVNYRTLCVMGSRFDEDYLRVLLQDFVNSAEHIVLRRHGSMPSSLTLARHRFRVVEYPSHQDLLPFVRSIAVPSPSQGSDHRTTRTAEPSSVYVPASLVATGEEPSEEDAIKGVFGLPTSRPLPIPPDEEDVAQGHRTLLVGAPGSGKSELVRQVVSMPTDRPVVLVRLAEADLRPASSEVVLQRWLTRAYTADGATVDLDPSRLHLILDGVDEVPVERQRLAAQLIADLAATSPQHRFTVTSRSVAALERFELASSDGPEWRQIRLAPDQAWLDRYLAARGTSFEELESEMPALPDLGELLHLPFFVKSAVDLHDSGRLAGMPNLPGLLAELVTMALEREISELPLDVDSTRRWLRAVALAMQVSGRTALAAKDVGLVEIPGEIAGSDETAIESLVQRLLLRGDQREIAFLHRIIGEHLASEALTSLTPSRELLDCLAPVDGDSIRGFRPDLRVVLSLLCLQNDAWREALRERDPLAVAKATPATASSDERRTAAQLLWDTYTAWDVWMWERENPSLINAVEACGRLLRGGELDDLVEQVRSAISADSAQIQGNAIRVLGQHPPTDFPALLETILRDDAREEVVRRQAAIIARDLDLSELVPAIIDRAVATEDEVEIQDMTLAAVRMPGARKEVEATLLALAPNPRAASLALALVGDQVTPQAQLKVARAMASGDRDRYSYERRFAASAVEALVADGSANEESVRDLGYIATRWAIESGDVNELLLLHPEAALDGLLTAHEGEAWWDIGRYLRLFDAALLERAGVPEEMIELTRPPTQAARAAAAIEEVERGRGESAEPERGRTDPPNEGEEWTLPALLAQGREMDALITHHCQYYASQVADLEPEEKHELGERLVDWWPDKPFRETITRTDSHSWRQEGGAAAWLWYGPALEMAVEPDRWGQLATCGVLFSDQIQWLRDQCSARALDAAVDWADMPSLGSWCQLFSCCSEITTELADALVNSVETWDRPHELRQVVSSLLEAGFEPQARRLLELDPRAESEARPLFARFDAGARVAELEQLIRDLKTGSVNADRDLDWLETCTADLLAGLFEALELSSQRPVGESSGWHDLNQPLISAISGIGGTAAVAGYDELLKDHENRWLRHQRDAVADEVLLKRGAFEGPRATALMGVPWLGAPEGV